MGVHLAAAAFALSLAPIRGVMQADQFFSAFQNTGTAPFNSPVMVRR